MNRFMLISQWVLWAVILAFAFRHSYRAHRITRFTVFFTWGLLAFHGFVFASYGQYAGGHDADNFLEGPHVVVFLILGWLYGLVVGVLAVGSWRALHGVPLFKFSSNDEHPGA